LISCSPSLNEELEPKYLPDQEEPLSLADIRELLEYCKFDRLRTYILVLASSGFKAIEASSLRTKDIDFTVTPTRITVRKEYSKTKRSTEIHFT
jgi:integrase